MGLTYSPGEVLLQDSAVEVLLHGIEVEMLSEIKVETPEFAYDLALKMNSLTKKIVNLASYHRLNNEEGFAKMHEEEILTYAFRSDDLCQRIFSSKAAGKELIAKTLLLQADIRYYIFGNAQGASINIQKVKSMYLPSDNLYVKAQGLENYINYHSSRNIPITNSQ